MYILYTYIHANIKLKPPPPTLSKVSFLPSNSELLLISFVTEENCA